MTKLGLSYATNLRTGIITDEHIRLFLQQAKDKESLIYFKSYWNKFPISKFWNILKKLSNEEIVELAFYFEYRYRSNIFSEIYPEKDFLKALIIKIRDKKSLKHHTLRNESFKILLHKLEKAIETIEKNVKFV